MKPPSNQRHMPHSVIFSFPFSNTCEQEASNRLRNLDQSSQSGSLTNPDYKLTGVIGGVDAQVIEQALEKLRMEVFILQDEVRQKEQRLKEITDSLTEKPSGRDIKPRTLLALDSA